MISEITAHILSGEGATSWCGCDLIRGGYLCITPVLARGRLAKYTAAKMRLHDFTREERVCLGCVAEMLFAGAESAAPARDAGIRT